MSFDFIKKNEKGFGMIEIIVSIGIIVVGTISIMSLFAANIKAEIRNKNKLIAIYLAQEQIEVARKIRDDFWLSGSIDPDQGNEIDGAIDIFNSSKTSIILEDINKPYSWGLSGNPFGIAKKVYINTTGGYYGQSSDVNLSTVGGWKDTGFQRSVEFKKGTGGNTKCDIENCLKIVSTVQYNGVDFAKVTAYIYGGWYY